MCNTCDFIGSVFDAARRDASRNYMPVIMLLGEMEKQEQIELFAGDCPIDEVSFHLGEEKHLTIHHYFKCISHSRFLGARYFYVGVYVRGSPSYKVLDTLRIENLPDSLWGRTGSMFK